VPLELKTLLQVYCFKSS